MKTRTKPKAAKAKAGKAKRKAKEAKSYRSERVPIQLRDGAGLIESLSPQERLCKLLRCVGDFSANLNTIEVGLARKTRAMKPEKAWTCIAKDIAQMMDSLQGQPSDIDCSVLHALNSIVFSVGVRIHIAEADADAEERDWAIRQGFSEIQSMKPRLNTLAGKLTQIVRAGSNEPADGLQHELPKRPRGMLNREVAELWKAGERSSTKMAQTLNCRDAGTYAPTSRKSVEGTDTWKKKHKRKAH